MRVTAIRLTRLTVPSHLFLVIWWYGNTHEFVYLGVN